MTEVLIARFGTTIVSRQDNMDAAADMSNYQLKRLCQRQGDARPIKNVSHVKVLQRFQHWCQECPCLAILLAARAAWRTLLCWTARDGGFSEAHMLQRAFALKMNAHMS